MLHVVYVVVAKVTPVLRLKIVAGSFLSVDLVAVVVVVCNMLLCPFPFLVRFGGDRFCCLMVH